MGLFLISDIKRLCFGAEDVKAAYIGSEQVWPVGPAGIEFADPEVLRVLLANGVDTDGDGGITEEEAAAATSISGWFKENTTIETFDEFEKFTGVTTLATELFYACTNLISIKLPKSIKTVSTLAFYKVPAVFEVDLPNLETIYLGAFWTSSISSIIDLGKITVLADGTNARGVFRDCTNLVSANLPNSLTTIGSYCFYNDTNLVSVNYDWTKAIKINTHAFYNCTSLAIEDLQLPNLTSLGQVAFCGVKIKKISNLGKITSIPNGNSYIGVFASCSDLTSVILPYTLTNIGHYAFYKCSNLPQINIPNSVDTIGVGAFMGCTALTSVQYKGESLALGGSAFKETTNLVEFIGMEKITSLGDSSFNSTGLKVINMPNLVEVTGYYHFSNSAVERVESLGSATTVPDFKNCKNLKYVRTPDTITSVDRNIFYSSTLETLVMDAVTPPSLSSTFSEIADTFNIYVPDESVEAYKTATGWSYYADRIKPLSEYVES